MAKYVVFITLAPSEDPNATPVFNWDVRDLIDGTNNSVPLAERAGASLATGQAASVVGAQSAAEHRALLLSEETVYLYDSKTPPTPAP